MFLSLLNELLYVGQAGKEWLKGCSLHLKPISAGFPFPAEEGEFALDLNQLMITNYDATFFLRVQSYAMEEGGIFNEDIVVVDRSLKVEEGNVVVVFIKGVFVVRRFVKIGKKKVLKSDNKQYPWIEIGDSDDFEIWGTVTFVIHKP